MQTKSMSPHTPIMGKDEWLTPPEIIKSLGKFDLDPCAPIIRVWDTAEHHFNICDDGLSKKWFGRVWCNPPYGLHSKAWLEKLTKHKNGIALIFARTDTDMFFEYGWNKATAMFFIRGRLTFYHVDGTKAKHNSGATSVLIAYNEENAFILRNLNMKGKYIHLKNNKPWHSI